mmetsp:Transcript_36936/g.44516  ORF Transcript_36936/g.44516 Transcript_36936/m.44516 type:complete len:445 (+) Transcript_36936:320-1654(+)
MRQAISERPIEYLSIPCVAAFVGISTNWMGVNMLFYPIEYLGVDWYRPDKNCPYGIFGWQGVVPARTEKMASRLVDIVTKDLLSLKEAFSHIEPRKLAGLLSSPVEEAVRRESGEWWAYVLKPVLPFILERVLTALSRDIEDVLDLPHVVLDAFVRDKIVLVELFQKVGRVELDFLVKSGFGFGFVLGLAQMGFWAIKPYTWTLPIAGSLVGYVTNWIAIKLLFEPADPVYIGPLVLQGLFESRQVEVSDEFGHFLESRVLSSPQLLGALSNHNEEELFVFLRKELPPPIPEHIIYAAMQAIRNVAANPEKYDEIHRYVAKRLNIEETLSSRLKLLTPKSFENLLHPVFEEDEIILIVVGGVLGAITGLMQTRLGWGGHNAKAKAVATLVGSLSLSAFFFFLPEIQQKPEVKPISTPTGNYESAYDRAPPKIKRRNTVLRPKNF